MPFSCWGCSFGLGTLALTLTMKHYRHQSLLTIINHDDQPFLTVILTTWCYCWLRIFTDLPCVSFSFKVQEPLKLFGCAAPTGSQRGGAHCCWLLARGYVNDRPAWNYHDDYLWYPINYHVPWWLPAGNNYHSILLTESEPTTQHTASWAVGSEQASWQHVDVVVLDGWIN